MKLVVARWRSSCEKREQFDPPAFYALGRRSDWPRLESLLQEYDVDNVSITSNDSFERLKSIIQKFDYKVDPNSRGTYVLLSSKESMLFEAI